MSLFLRGEVFLDLGFEASKEKWTDDGMERLHQSFLAPLTLKIEITIEFLIE